MNLAIDIASWVLLVSGSFFCLVGGIGILRLPEVYSRMHAAGMTDSLGAVLILVGLALQAGPTLVTVKLLSVWVFLYLTSPAATMALARAAYLGGVRIEVKRSPPNMSTHLGMPAVKG